MLQSVLQEAKAVDLLTDETDEERLKKWLEEVSPEDLGKYTGQLVRVPIARDRSSESLIGREVGPPQGLGERRPVAI